MAKYEGITKASASSIEIDFIYQGVRCRPRIKLPATENNLKYASRLRSKILLEIEAGTFRFDQYFPKHPLCEKFTPAVQYREIGEALDEWLEKPTISGQLQPTTLKAYDKSVNQLSRYFGNKKVGELTKADLLDMADSLDITQKTLNNLLIPLKRFYQYLYNREEVLKDPFYGLEIKAQRKNLKPDIDPFTEDECSLIMNKADEQTRNIVEFVFNSGLRPSEWFALKWEDIDWTYDKIHIQRAHVYGHDKETKTIAGNRLIDLTEGAKRALLRQKSRTYMVGGYVFLYGKKPYIRDKTFRELTWQPLLRRAKVRYRPPKQLRHAFATHQILSGCNLYWLSNMMGHTSPKITLDIYYRWIEKAGTNAGTGYSNPVKNSQKIDRK